MSTTAWSPAMAATARSATRASGCASSPAQIFMCPYCSRVYVLNPGHASNWRLRLTEASHLVLVDGSGFIFRAFHALPPMTRPDGTPVNAVFGFTNMLARLLKATHVGTHLAVIFDAGRTTFRNRLYDQYKAQRPEPPPELRPQFALVREAPPAFGVPAIELADWEADDLIASYYTLAATQRRRPGDHRSRPTRI